MDVTSMSTLAAQYFSPIDSAAQSRQQCPSRRKPPDHDDDDQQSPQHSGTSCTATTGSPSESRRGHDRYDRRRRTRLPVRMAEHFHHAGSSSSGQPYGLNFRRSRSIRSEGNLELRGPLDVAGTVKGRSLTFEGDFIVSDRIEAYGSIDVNGNMTCEGRIKAYGDITVTGTLTASDKIKCSGRLRLNGTLHGTDVEIFGNATINGYLTCRSLTVYGTLTLIGNRSTYRVAEHETIVGPKLRRDREPDWDL